MPEEGPNTGPEISELQMMAESQANPEITVQQDNINDSQPHTGWEDTHLNTNVHFIHSLLYNVLASCFRTTMFDGGYISRHCNKPQALETHITVDVNLDLCAPLVFTIDYNNFRNDDNTPRNINLWCINFLA